MSAFLVNADNGLIVIIGAAAVEAQATEVQIELVVSRWIARVITRLSQRTPLSYPFASATTMK